LGDCPENKQPVDRERKLWIGGEEVDLLHYAYYQLNGTVQPVRSCFELKAQGNLAEAKKSDDNDFVKRIKKDLEKCSVKSVFRYEYCGK
jgi:hypothetical protein